MPNLSWKRNIKALPMGAGETDDPADLGGRPCAPWSSGAVCGLQLSGWGAGGGSKPCLRLPGGGGELQHEDRPPFLFTFLFCICVPTSASWFAFSPEGFGIHASIQLLSSLPSSSPSPSLVHVHEKCCISEASLLSRCCWDPSSHPHTAIGRAALSCLPFVGPDRFIALVQMTKEAFALDFETPWE